MLLGGRRILVTAGPTRVPIDAVRYISNVSSGGTGLKIALQAASAGAEVTLLLGPGTVQPVTTAGLRVARFVTFDELHRQVREHVGSRAYDAVIHAAAVSDYRVKSEEAGKIPSGEAELTLRLAPTPKIVDEIRGLDPGVTLVKFKLEVGRSEAELLEIARRSGERSDADFVVANDLERITGGAHPAWILDRERVAAKVETNDALADRLVDVLSDHLRGRPLRAVSDQAAVLLASGRMV
ncbi:MAG: phosphopantothenoylcysteine decarboxylase [Actinomycetota bacterium]